jgi:hypothetical protein
MNYAGSRHSIVNINIKDKEQSCSQGHFVKCKRNQQKQVYDFRSQDK